MGESVVRRIAVEEAFVTADVIKAWERALRQADVEPGFAQLGANTLADTPGNKWVHDRLLDLDADRLARMDEDGIDVHVLSLTAPGVQMLRDAALATRLAREANDVLADAIKRHPTRFGGLGAVAPQDPVAAAKEIERCAGPLGLNGLVINSHTNGDYLDQPKYSPIFEAAQAAGLAIYLHPREPAPSLVGPFLDYGLYFAVYGFAVEAALHAMRLILSGTFDRFPGLKIVLGHMGEGLPFWLQRIDNRYQLS